jgi:hypothetical protein
MRKLMKQFWNLGTPLEEHVNMNGRCPNIPWHVRLTIAQQKSKINAHHKEKVDTFEYL